MTQPDSHAAGDTGELLHLPLTGKARVKYFFIRALFKAASRIAAILPERVTYALCVGLAMFGYKRFPRFRRMARAHLDIAFGAEKSPAEIETILRQTYANQGRNLAEFLMIPHKNADWVNRKVHLNDPGDHLNRELAQGRGVIAVGAHIGNIELVCAWIGVNKLPMVTVVKAQRDALFTKFLTDVRSKWDTQMIFRARGVKRECLKQMGENKIIGLVADQNVARNGVFVDFFGKKASTAVGPADIAMQTGRPVLPAFWATRNPDNTLTVHVLDPIAMRDSGDRAADLVHNAQLYTTAIENFVRAYPAEYLWWHQRWKTRPADEA